MFSRCSQDVCRIFPGYSNGSCGPGGIWWSFQMKVWTLMTQGKSMIPSYSMIPAILWSQLFDDHQLFDDPKLFDDPQLFDDQLEVWTLIIQKSTVIPPSRMVLFFITLLINMQFILFQLADLTADSVSERLWAAELEGGNIGASDCWGEFMGKRKRLPTSIHKWWTLY